jgi:hypothetical protein
MDGGLGALLRVGFALVRGVSWMAAFAAMTFRWVAVTVWLQSAPSCPRHGRAGGRLRKFRCVRRGVGWELVVGASYVSTSSEWRVVMDGRLRGHDVGGVALKVAPRGLNAERATPTCSAPPPRR